ncbi:sigma-70 family RNA polymerase sigma factor [Candidatus Dojkabacteria bacterium]|uniref:Sigma-70 family RNA polymerase sigma factor n=1 Tax=Candidatus Dojkabacteria bacterium TaxID=2099670 RepID=A0A955L229_9BACT|nr:sigma-70 family RNA polymerase sigma factor [Candidatus Dojkabacteria bacterium]
MKRTEQLQTIYSNHAEELYRFCKFKTRSNEDAEDLVSEAFIKLFEQDEFDEIENPRAWLYKVARNMIYDNTKKHTTSNIDDEQIENISSSDFSVEKESVNNATIEYLEFQMQNLDDDTADIIIMRVWDDMKFSDIAEAMSMGVDAVRKRFNRGIKELKSLVSREEKMLNIKSLSVPFILAGILGISTQPAYAFTAATSASVASAVGSTLGFTFSNMINNNLTAGATTAGSGILATTAAKLIAGSAIVLAGAGVGIGAIAIQSNQPEPIPTQQEQNGVKIEDENSNKDVTESFESLNEEWYLYTNTEIGFSIEIPKEIKAYRGGCEYRIDSYRPQQSLVPIKTFIDNDIVYFGPRYYYELGGQSIQPGGTSNFSECNYKDLTTLDNLLTNEVGIEYIWVSRDSSGNLIHSEVGQAYQFFDKDYLPLDETIYNSIIDLNNDETELSQTCTYPSIGLQLKLPEGWDCGYTDSNEEILWVNIGNPWYDIHFSKLGRGPYCGDGPQDSENTCVTEPFVENGFMIAHKYIANGQLGEIFGTFLNTSTNYFDGWWISIRETPAQITPSLILTSNQKETLEAILNSFEKI